MSKQVYLDSIGCRLNQSEIATMERQFQQRGYKITQDPQQADLVVVNTCAVTNAAAKDSRKMIRSLHRANENAEISVTGCYAHVDESTVAKLPGVAHVMNNFDKDNLVALVTDTPQEPFDAEPIARHYAPGAAGLTRAFVKVQDGCDNACTFCITTIARGAGRSRPLEEVVREVQLMVEGGYQEIVLTGVHLGSYGHDFGNRDGLRDLIQALLRATDIPRIRLSSLEPWDLSENFFELWDNPRMCRHLHLPLQSGCDITLKRMLRNTSQAEFQTLVEAARQHIPGLALSTDVIVGFPGEDDAEFQESRDFIEAMGFMKIHVFPYSKRDGTPAAKMEWHNDKHIAKNRLREIQMLSDEGSQRFREAHIGAEMSVLWEQIRGASDEGFWHIGLTDNYIRVEMKHPDVLTNVITPTRLQSIVPNAMVGESLGEDATHEPSREHFHENH